jgi:hypothetical protein
MGILETVAQRTQQESLMQAKDDLLHATQMAANGCAPGIETIFKAALAAGTLSNAACAANARLTDQVEHLKRLIALLDIRTRGQGERENRVLLNRVRNLERQVSELRQKMKGTS